MFPLLEEFKTYVQMMDEQKVNQITAYTKFSDFLAKYEEKMFDQFSPGGSTKNGDVELGAADTKKVDVKVKLKEMREQIATPYKRFKYWIKEEILDLHSLMEAISSKDGM